MSDTPGHTIPIGQLTDLSSACSQLRMVFDNGGSDNCTVQVIPPWNLMFSSVPQCSWPTQQKKYKPHRCDNIHVLRCGIYRIYKCPDMFLEMVITLPIPWSTHLWIASLKENHGNVNTVRRLHHRLVIKGMDRIILETGNPNIGHIKKTHQTCVNCFILGINQFD